MKSHNRIELPEVDQVGEQIYGNKALVKAACEKFFASRGMGRSELNWNRNFDYRKLKRNKE